MSGCLNNAAITVVSTTAYVNPIVAVALGVVILNESMAPRTWLAAVIIIGAVVAIVTGRPRCRVRARAIGGAEAKPA